MPFRLNCRNVFLTYPQCGHLPEALGRHIATIFPTRYIHFVRERHQDGSFHLHGLIQWVDKHNVRNERIFDYQGSHPNIQPARDVAAVKDYIDKHFEDTTPPNFRYIEGEFEPTRKESKWLEVATATTELECIEKALQASPRDYVLHHERILDFAKRKQRQRVPYSHDDRITFRLPEPLIQYMTNEFLNPVGLLPWIYDEHTTFIDDQKNRLDLVPSCLSGQRAQARLRGPGRSTITFTGEACRTSPSSTKRQNT